MALLQFLYDVWLGWGRGGERAKRAEQFVAGLRVRREQGQGDGGAGLRFWQLLDY